jgi:hypothetical protein
VDHTFEALREVKAYDHVKYDEFCGDMISLARVLKQLGQVYDNVLDMQLLACIVMNVCCDGAHNDYFISVTTTSLWCFVRAGGKCLPEGWQDHPRF